MTSQGMGLAASLRLALSAVDTSHRLVVLVAAAGGCMASVAPALAQTPFDAWRAVPMQGTLNTRDIGGYATMDGRTVVKGRIYRSANLAQITPADVQALGRLGVDTVVDFRGQKEAKLDPDRLPAGTDYLNSPIIGSAKGDDIDDATIAGLVARHGLPASVKDRGKVTPHGPYYRMLFLVDSYGDKDHLARLKGYRPLFQKLLALKADSNVLYHCTGGRDRTGVGTALVLKALGVPDAAIEADFVASNRYLQPGGDDPDSLRFLQFQSANVFLQPSANKRFQTVAASLDTTPDVLRGAVELRPELLRRLFTSIDAQYGSFDAFLETEMGIGPQERAELKRRYTE
jgi:protein-tyrosine phosphatase